MTETIPEMLWSATPEGAIDYCNARVLDYTGFSAEEIMGNGWTETSSSGRRRSGGSRVDVLCREPEPRTGSRFAPSTPPIARTDGA